MEGGRKGRREKHRCERKTHTDGLPPTCTQARSRVEPAADASDQASNPPSFGAQANALPTEPTGQGFLPSCLTIQPRRWHRVDKNPNTGLFHCSVLLPRLEKQQVAQPQGADPLHRLHESLPCAGADTAALSAHRGPVHKPSGSSLVGPELGTAYITLTGDSSRPPRIPVRPRGRGSPPLYLLLCSCLGFSVVVVFC